MRIDELLFTIARTPGCRIVPAAGIPRPEQGHVLPEDLRSFYELCGGVELYRDRDYPITIVPPAEFRLANPEIVGPVWERDDISASWYIVADAGNREFITIDLDPARLGRCYDSFPYSHAVAGSSMVIAQSFTELVELLHRREGGRWYWLEPDFQGYGDAYD